MNSSNKILLWFSAALAVLVIITVSLVFTVGRQTPAVLPENTPDGTVQRYLQALQDKDYLTAWNYLSPSPDDKTLTYSNWVTSLPTYYGPESSWKASLDKVSDDGTKATVEVTIETFRAGSPLGSSVRTSNVLFTLSKASGRWLITAPTYIYWIY